MGLGVAHDHRLAAAQVEPGHRGLVRHPARQAQRVDEGFLVGRVVPEARAAQRRPEHGVVDGNDPLVPARRLVAENDLLVLVLADRRKQFHALARCRSA
jgi:hypothetical protein